MMEARAYADPATESPRHFRSPVAGLLSPSGVAAPALPKRQLAIKRAVDLTVSAFALVLLLPLFVLVAVLIKLESPGPVLFTQTRWGQGGSRIKVFKFRSMRTDLCDASGVAQTVEGDPRVTRVGKLIRKTNVDELPQLLNVLFGDMSLVGPRCHPVGMLAAGVPYEVLVPTYHERHALKPGITGLAQVRGFRGPTTRTSKARARIYSDLYYVRNFSLLLDIKILFWTVASELKGGTGF
ncbi:sugar transferase [Pseudorhizobium marinum]|uniref:sugar transferase n=1 Tax=Pseudorhizobium marinum TaxID=1496690 RepID=UPI0009DFD05C|nr:sugar transferase [Pseudorhizobium marinum]